MNEKKIGASFKINPNSLRKLNEGAKKSQMSLNSFVNLIFQQYVDWHSTSVEAGVSTIFKPMLKHLLNALDEDSIKNLAKKVAKEEGKDFMMLLSHEYNIHAALKLIETWLGIIKYPYSHDQNGTEHKFFIHHDMGRKYSVYLSSLYESVLDEFDISKSKFQISDNSISFVVNTEQNS